MPPGDGGGDERGLADLVLDKEIISNPLIK